jgi:hypothetical protein
MDKLKKTHPIVMKAILQGWNFMRILRLGLGIAILVQGIIAKEAITMVLGAVFAAMALAKIGCCATSGCAINSRSTNNTHKINNEELDIKK